MQHCKQHRECKQRQECKQQRDNLLQPVDFFEGVTKRLQSIEKNVIAPVMGELLKWVESVKDSLESSQISLSAAMLNITTRRRPHSAKRHAQL